MIAFYCFVAILGGWILIENVSRDEESKKKLKELHPEGYFFHWEDGKSWVRDK